MICVRDQQYAPLKLIAILIIEERRKQDTEASKRREVEYRLRNQLTLRRTADVIIKISLTDSAQDEKNRTLLVNRRAAIQDEIDRFFGV